MFEYNDKVEDKEGNIYRVVAPVDGEQATTVVWSDGECNALIIFPTEELTETDKTLQEGEYAHITYDANTLDNGKVKVVRRLDTKGMNTVIGIYDDLRGFVSDNLEDITVERLDELIKESKNTEEG